MKILFAADGSSFTKKALAFLVTHENIAGPDDQLFVLNVQLAVPARVKRMLGCDWVAGSPAGEIVLAAGRERSRMIVMGTACSAAR